MDNSQGTYWLTAQAYAAGVRKLFTIGSKAQGVERSVEPSASPRRLETEKVASQASQLEWVSRNLTWAAASAITDPDPNVRAEASTRLLAKAMVDLQVSAFLLDIAQQNDPNSVRAMERGGISSAIGAGVPPMVEEYLAVLHGPAAPAVVRGEPQRRLPGDLASARAQLSQQVADTLVSIEERAGRTAQGALGGLLTMGVGQVFKAAGMVGMNIAASFGAAEKTSQLYTLFRQFFQNAYNTLIALLGEDLSKAAANQVAAWVNDMVEGQKFLGLLEKLYETSKTRLELCQLVETSPATLKEFNAVISGIDDLNAQYLKQIMVVDKMLTVLRFVPAVPAAALPQGQLLLGVTYIVLCGYVIFAGADYVDAPQMLRLDRVPGPRAIITSGLPARPEKPVPPPPTVAPQQTPAKEPPKSYRGIEEDAPKPPLGGVSYSLGDSTETYPPHAHVADDEGFTGYGGGQSAKPPVKEPTPPPSKEVPAARDVQPPPPQPVLAGVGGETTTSMLEEKIRLDVAAPHTPVIVGDTFEIAVAIRRPKSDKLSLEGLDMVVSGDGVVYRHEAKDLVRYRVVVSAPECEIATPEYLFSLRTGRDSPPRFFQLTPKRAGSLSIIVTAFQEGELVAQTRVRVTASVEAKEAERLSTEESRRVLVDDLTVKPKQPARVSKVKEFIDLDIELFDYEINDQQVERFKVRVVCDLCGEQRLSDADIVEIPPKVRAQLSLLKRRQLNSGEIIVLGKQLGQMLFPPRARSYFQRARATLDEEKNALRIRIKVDQFPLANIAWEYAYLAPEDAPDSNDPEGFLVLDRYLSLVRYEVMGQQVVDLEPVGDSPLRMVMLLSNSTEPEFPKLNLSQERKNITQALENMPAIALECFNNATIQILQEALENPAFIFHFAGHGTFQGELGPIRGTLDGEGYLVLKGRSPRESLFSARKLALNLKGRGVRLAVLGVCEGGERDPVNAWTGIAPALARAGIPAVVSMQFSVYDESAIAFHRAFYRALAQGYPVDTAVSNGRLAIYNLPTSDRDWGVPVLYLRCDDGVLFPR